MTATTVEGRISLRVEERVGWITIERPEKLNAFVGTMRDDLADLVARAAADHAVRVIVITGAGRAFCAGADVDVMAELLEHNDERTFGGYVRAGARAVLAIAAAPQPVIAGVNGVAAGAGASLAACCDMRVFSDAARIGFTFNRIGLHPDWGATHFLPRLVGSGRASDLILSARMIDAAEAKTIGLADGIVEGDVDLFREGLRATAAELAAASPTALAAGKRSLRAAEEDAVRAALDREAEAQIALFRGADVREGIAAFREKRAAAYAGE
jgi:2-(1,2-epoxy-1,2-dihydrophenyl)acetyl-CoA isomerase